MVRQSLKILSGKLCWLVASVGLLTLGLTSDATAGWPHHGRNVGLWHTPISSVGQCYPRSVISYPAPYRCNPGFYLRRDACDYRWSFNYNRYCAPRGWCHDYRSFYDCRPACLPVFPSYYCPPTYYYGAYPMWYSNGIFLGVGNQAFAQNQIQYAARNAAPPAALNNMLQQALALDARANQLRPANTALRNYYRDRAGEESVVSIDTPRSLIQSNPIEDRLAQTRSIMSKTYNSSAGISNVSRSSYTTDRSDLVAATNRLNQYRSNTSTQTISPTPRSAVSKMVDGDIAFSKGHYHTAEIYYRQVGRDSIELKKDAAIRLACSQFARGDYLKAAQTFRWVNEQETVIEIGSKESDDSNPILAQWKSGLPKQQLARLFADRVVLEQHLNRLADRALQTENNGTELWLLGVLMGLDGDDNKSELFLAQASQTTGDFANTAKFLVNSGRDQSSLQLAAQSHRSP